MVVSAQGPDAGHKLWKHAEHPDAAARWIAPLEGVSLRVFHRAPSRPRQRLARGLWAWWRNRGWRDATQALLLGFADGAHLFTGRVSRLRATWLLDHVVFSRSVVPGMAIADVGAGTGFSLLRTLGDAYSVSQARAAPLSGLRGFYLATLGGARALYLDDCIGNFQPGREADFVVLEWAATPELAWRLERCTSLAERLFALMMLGDERCVVATHVMGEAAWVR